MELGRDFVKGSFGGFGFFAFRGEDEEGGVVFTEYFSSRFLVESHDDRGFVIFNEFLEFDNAEFSFKSNFGRVEFSEKDDRFSGGSEMAGNFRGESVGKRHIIKRFSHLFESFKVFSVGSEKHNDNLAFSNEGIDFFNCGFFSGGGAGLFF
jgi:hypothetical protein